MEISNVIFKCKNCENNTNTKKPFGLKRNNLRFQMYGICTICEHTKSKFLNATATALLPQELQKMKNFEVYLVKFIHNDYEFDFFEILRSVLD